jgi:hypothetical protein
VFIEICDGNAPTVTGWDPTINCDIGSSPSPSAAAATTGNVSWPATTASNSITVFRGQSPSQLFNCVSTSDLPANPVKNADGSYNLDGTLTTANGEPIFQGVESWTNDASRQFGCQMRMSTSNSGSTTDQQFLGLVIPGQGASVPEAPFAVLLPVGAIGLLGGGLLLARRRRSARAAA